MIYGWHLVEFGQGWKLVKKINISNVLIMVLPTVENLNGLCGNIYCINWCSSRFGSPQLHLGKYEINRIVLKFSHFPNYPRYPCLGSCAGVIEALLIQLCSWNIPPLALSGAPRCCLEAMGWLLRNDSCGVWKDGVFVVLRARRILQSAWTASSCRTVCVR